MIRMDNVLIDEGKRCYQSNDYNCGSRIFHQIKTTLKKMLRFRLKTAQIGETLRILFGQIRLVIYQIDHV